MCIRSAEQACTQRVASALLEQHCTHAPPPALQWVAIMPCHQVPAPRQVTHDMFFTQVLYAEGSCSPDSQQQELETLGPAQQQPAAAVHSEPGCHRVHSPHAAARPPSQRMTPETAPATHVQTLVFGARKLNARKWSSGLEHIMHVRAQ